MCHRLQRGHALGDCEAAQLHLHQHLDHATGDNEPQQTKAVFSPHLGRGNQLAGANDAGGDYEAGTEVLEDATPVLWRVLRTIRRHGGRLGFTRTMTSPTYFQRTSSPGRRAVAVRPSKVLPARLMVASAALRIPAIRRAL